MSRISIIIFSLIIVLLSSVGIINVASHYKTSEELKKNYIPSTQTFKEELNLLVSNPKCNVKSKKIYDENNIKIYSECGNITLNEENVEQVLKDKSVTMAQILDRMTIVNQTAKMDIYKYQEMQVIACQPKENQTTYYFVGLTKKTSKLCS